MLIFSSYFSRARVDQMKVKMKGCGYKLFCVFHNIANHEESSRINICCKLLTNTIGKYKIMMCNRFAVKSNFWGIWIILNQIFVQLLLIYVTQGLVVQGQRLLRNCLINLCQCSKAIWVHPCLIWSSLTTKISFF